MQVVGLVTHTTQQRFFYEKPKNWKQLPTKKNRLHQEITRSSDIRTGDNEISINFKNNELQFTTGEGMDSKPQTAEGNYNIHHHRRRGQKLLSSNNLQQPEDGASTKHQQSQKETLSAAAHANRQLEKPEPNYMKNIKKNVSRQIEYKESFQRDSQVSIVQRSPIMSKNQEFRNSFQNKYEGPAGYRGESITNKEARASFQPPTILNSNGITSAVAQMQQSSIHSSQKDNEMYIPDKIRHLFQDKRGKSTQSTKRPRNQKTKHQIPFITSEDQKRVQNLNMDLQEFQSPGAKKSRESNKRQQTLKGDVRDYSNADNELTNAFDNPILRRSVSRDRSNSISQGSGGSPEVETTSKQQNLTQRKGFTNYSPSSKFNPKSVQSKRMETTIGGGDTTSTFIAAIKESLDDKPLSSRRAQQFGLTQGNFNINGGAHWQKNRSPVNSGGSTLYGNFNIGSNYTGNIYAQSNPSQRGEPKDNNYIPQEVQMNKINSQISALKLKQDKLYGGNYRNLNKKYNKIEMMKLEEDLKKNITVRRMAPQSLAASGSNTDRNFTFPKSQSKNWVNSIEQGSQPDTNLIDSARKISTIGEKSREQTLNHPDEDYQSRQNTQNNDEQNSLENSGIVGAQKLAQALKQKSKAKTSHALKRKSQFQLRKSQENGKHFDKQDYYVGGEQVEHTMSEEYTEPTKLYENVTKKSISSHHSVVVKNKRSPQQRSNDNIKIEEKGTKKLRSTALYVPNQSSSGGGNQEENARNMMKPHPGKTQNVHNAHYISQDSSNEQSQASGVNPLAIYNNINQDAIIDDEYNENLSEDDEAQLNQIQQALQKQDLKLPIQQMKHLGKQPAGSNRIALTAMNQQFSTNVEAIQPISLDLANSFQNYNLLSDFKPLPQLVQQPPSRQRVYLKDVSQKAEADRESQQEGFVNDITQHQPTSRLKSRRNIRGLFVGSNTSKNQNVNHDPSLNYNSRQSSIRDYEVQMKTANFPQQCMSSRRLSVSQKRISLQSRQSQQKASTTSSLFGFRRRRGPLRLCSKETTSPKKTDESKISKSPKNPSNIEIINQDIKLSPDESKDQFSTCNKNSQDQNKQCMESMDENGEATSPQSPQTAATPIQMVSDRREKQELSSSQRIMIRSEGSQRSKKQPKSQSKVMSRQSSMKEKDIDTQLVASMNPSQQSLVKIQDHTSKQSDENPMQNPFIQQKSDYIDSVVAFSRHNSNSNQQKKAVVLQNQSPHSSLRNSQLKLSFDKLINNNNQNLDLDTEKVYKQNIREDRQNIIFQKQNSHRTKTEQNVSSSSVIKGKHVRHISHLIRDGGNPQFFETHGSFQHKRKHHLGSPQLAGAVHANQDINIEYSPSLKQRLPLENKSQYNSKPSSKNSRNDDKALQQQLDYFNSSQSYGTSHIETQRENQEHYFHPRFASKQSTKKATMGENQNALRYENNSPQNQGDGFVQPMVPALSIHKAQMQMRQQLQDSKRYDILQQKQKQYATRYLPHGPTSAGSLAHSSSKKYVPTRFMKKAKQSFLYQALPHVNQATFNQYKRLNNKDYAFHGYGPRPKRNKRHHKSLATESYASTLKRNSIYNVVQNAPGTINTLKTATHNNSTDLDAHRNQLGVEQHSNQAASSQAMSPPGGILTPRKKQFANMLAQSAIVFQSMSAEQKNQILSQQSQILQQLSAIHKEFQDTRQAGQESIQSSLNDGGNGLMLPEVQNQYTTAYSNPIESAQKLDKDLKKSQKLNKVLELMVQTQNMIDQKLSTNGAQSNEECNANAVNN